MVTTWMRGPSNTPGRGSPSFVVRRSSSWRLSAAALSVSLVLTGVYRPLVLPLFVAGVALGALAIRSLWRRWDLVDRLADDRDAHVIPEVGAYAARHGRVDDEADVDGTRHSG